MRRRELGEKEPEPIHLFNSTMQVDFVTCPLGLGDLSSAMLTTE